MLSPNIRKLSLSFGVFAAVGCGSQNPPAAEAASATAGAEEPAIAAPEVPSELAVPEGNRLAFSYQATGQQVYKCLDDGTAWKLDHPNADLVDDGGQPAGTHSAGPTWTALDGSAVTGKAPPAASVPSPEGSIPWLKLEANTHAGSGRMSNVSFIQRLKTKGGAAPAGTCTPGATLDVDYSATYSFYEAAPAK